MGKPPSSSQTQTQTQTRTHFSHPHPLKLISSPNSQTLISSVCAGCKKNSSGPIYICTICTTFFLHKNCFDMPKKITHPFHKAHPFFLLPDPAYAEGIFSCDACREPGSGFSYHCKPCGIDLHILCAAMPLSVSHACHVHELHLAFENPYGGKAYSCDICKNEGSSNTWLYRCNSCEFDAHLNCTRTLQSPHPQISKNFDAFPAHGPTPSPEMSYFRSAPQPHQVPNGAPHFAPHPHQPNVFANPNIPAAAAYGVPVGGGQVAQPFGANREYEMILQAIQQMNNNNAAMLQAVMAGGYGGNRGPQYDQMMQMIAAFNNGGVGATGGAMNAFGNGTGQLLQSLMSSGGGGAFDVLQNLIGGGGGGLDFLGGAFGLG
ncbi:uncharacterized protein LOC127262444 [Andrographis paniculata]|uniref:uncharacterized protein LOC127262444 n=1 Tax=Andrographis paniculata TaxID=175694 RepID=UPI0021E7C91B|nr:uncharacterized protein LOC127262444 [Andrographis paniculata]